MDMAAGSGRGAACSASGICQERGAGQDFFLEFFFFGISAARGSGTRSRSLRPDRNQGRCLLRDRTQIVSICVEIGEIGGRMLAGGAATAAFAAAPALCPAITQLGTCAMAPATHCAAGSRGVAGLMPLFAASVLLGRDDFLARSALPGPSFGARARHFDPTTRSMVNGGGEEGGRGGSMRRGRGGAFGRSGSDDGAFRRDPREDRARDVFARGASRGRGRGGARGSRGGGRGGITAPRFPGLDCTASVQLAAQSFHGQRESMHVQDTHCLQAGPVFLCLDAFW